MLKITDLPDTIALFPLPGALLLPRAKLPLHLFEPRYVAMLEDCMKTPTRLIGMIQSRGVPMGEAGRLHAIGCAGRLTSFSETEDGRYMIALTGISRFRMVQEIQDDQKPYRRARIDWAGFERDMGRAENDATQNRAALLALLGRYFTAVSPMTDWESLKDADDELLINALSMLCPFAPEERQALLEAPSLTTRRETLMTLMEFALRSASGQAGEKMQ
jgi:Lon protease-like protein